MPARPTLFPPASLDAWRGRAEDELAGRPFDAIRWRAQPGLVVEPLYIEEMGCEVADIGHTIHPHPTLSESVGMAAEVFDGTITDLYLPRKSRSSTVTHTGTTST
jgi:hypothetical protein